MYSGSIADTRTVEELENEFNRTTIIEKKIDLLIEMADIKNGNLDKTAINEIDAALKLAEKFDKHEKIADINTLYGTYWKIRSNFYQSINYFQKALKFYIDNDMKFETAMIYRALGEAYRASLDYDLALKSLKKAEKLFISLKDSMMLAKTYDRYAAVYFEIPDEDNTLKVIKYAKKALALFSPEDNIQLTLSLNNIIGSCYSSRQEFDLAEKHLFNAFNLIDENNKIYNYSMVLNNIVNMYRMQGKIYKAIHYGRLNFDFIEENDLDIYGDGVASFLTMCYDSLKRYDSAYYFASRTLDMKTAKFFQQKQDIMLELQAKYELERKQNEIDAEKTRTIYITVLSSTIIVFALILAILQFRKHKLLKKNNDEIIEKNNKIIDQNDELNKLNATKDKFFSIIAHDLRGPLGGLKLGSEMLSNDYNELSEKDKREFIDMFHESVNNIYDLLENLLLWSRSQRGIIEVNIEETDLASFVSNSVEVLKLQANNKKIKIDNNISLNEKINIDVNLTMTAIRNIISNSIKFTNPGGKIVLSSDISEEHLKIIISDTGIGMDSEQISMLFVIDKNKSTPGTNNESGTGLGLLICYDFIRKQGGNIKVSSSPGYGSVFEISLPNK